MDPLAYLRSLAGIGDDPWDKPDFAMGGGTDVSGLPSVSGSSVPGSPDASMPPAPQASGLQGFLQKYPSLPQGLLQMGLATMAAGSKPGATLLGSIGEGGLTATREMDKQRRLDAQEKRQAAQDDIAKETLGIRRMLANAKLKEKPPGFGGTGMEASSANVLLELGAKIKDGTATPDEVNRYALAYSHLTQPRAQLDPKTNQPIFMTPELPPQFPRPPTMGAAPQGASPGPTPETVPGNGAPPAPPSASPMASGTPPAAPPTLAEALALPQPGQTPPASVSVPGMTVTRTGEATPPPALDPHTIQTIDGKMLEKGEILGRLNEIQTKFKPEYQRLAPRAGQAWNSMKDFIGVDLKPEDAKSLADYTQFRQAATTNINQTIKDLTGSAMGVQEAERIISTMPASGTGILDGDSPTVFKAKLDGAVQATKNALLRYSYAKSHGLDPLKTGISLDEVPALINRRGQELEAQFKAGNPSASPDDIKKAVSNVIRKEFGIR